MGTSGEDVMREKGRGKDASNSKALKGKAPPPTTSQVPLCVSGLTL